MVMGFSFRQAGSVDVTLWKAALSFSGVNEDDLVEAKVDPPVDLHEFAIKYKMQGEKLVAADVVLRSNDKFFGQWLMLHVPFVRPEQFLRADVDELVPEEHRYLGMALKCDHPTARATWVNPAAIHQEMKTEGFRPKLRESTVSQIVAQAALVREYLDGTLDKKDEPSGLTNEEAVENQPFVTGRLIRFSIEYHYSKMIMEGTKTIEGRINMGSAAKVKVGDQLRLGSARKLVTDVGNFGSFREMLLSCPNGYYDAVPDAGSLQEAVDVYHRFKNYEYLASEKGVVAFELSDVPALSKPPPKRPEQPHPRQLQFENNLNECVDRALAVSDATSEEDSDLARKACWEHNEVQICEGPPGTGKTTFLFLCIERCLRLGGKVLFCTPTAQLASRMKEKFGNRIDIDTCHAALGLFGSPDDAAYCMSPYQLVCVDEMSQLSAPSFEHILKLHKYIDKVCGLALLGDRWQMGGMGGSTPWDSSWFKRCFVTTLIKPFRCEDPLYWRLLSGIRTTKPSERNLRGVVSVQDLMRGRRAWKGDKPKLNDMRFLLEKYPKAEFMAVSRRGTGLMNDLAVEALFGCQAPCAILPGDIESFAANYYKGKLKPFQHLDPQELRVHVGMKVFLTKNVRKDIDFVNGMCCTVEGFDSTSGGLRVITNTGKRVVVWRWTDKDLGFQTYYPVRPGYASTVLKFQGAELEFVILYLDAEAPGAAYTAMSRVKFGNRCLIGGNVNSRHFLPANHMMASKGDR
jgi:ASC-1-like (ASCH) protein